MSGMHIAYSKYGSEEIFLSLLSALHMGNKPFCVRNSLQARDVNTIL